MRIVQIGPMPPPHGGVSTNMMAIHESVVRAGHTSLIVDVTDRGRNEDREFVRKPRSAAGLLRLLAGIEADLLHYHIGGEFSLKLALLTLFCGLLPGKRSVVTFHSGGYAKRALSNARPMSIRGFAFRSQDRVIGVNEEMMRMFYAYGVRPEKAQMILPYELRCPDRSVVLPPELQGFAEVADPLIISVGALEREYRHELVIDSLPAVVEQFKNVKLLVAGSGPMRGRLEAKVAGLGLDDRVLLPGNVEHAVMLRLMETSGLVLRITDFDGDAISVREAMSLGTPVVATDNGMRPNGVRLISGTPRAEELADAIIESLAKGKCGTVNPPPEGNAEKVIALYESVIYR